MPQQQSTRRRLAARLPTASAILGMGFVFGSLVFYFSSSYVWSVVGVTIGIAFLLLGIWYAAHPFVVNERTNLQLRGVVREFIGMVRELHWATVEGDEVAVERLRGEMKEAVDRMVAASWEAHPRPSDGNAARG